MVKRTEMHGLQEESKFDDLALTRISELQQTLSEMEGELDALRQRQAQEQQAVTTLLDAEQQSPDRLPQLATELGELQDGGLPLVYPWVDDRVVAEVLSDWTGIPTGRMLQSDLDNALNLNQLLSRQIFGQQTAIDEIAQAVRISAPVSRRTIGRWAFSCCPARAASAKRRPRSPWRRRCTAARIT